MPETPSVPSAAGFAHPSADEHANENVQHEDSNQSPFARDIRSYGSKHAGVANSDSHRAVAAAAASNAHAPEQQQTTDCPGRKPYHTLLTAQGTTYNQWQARIMYHHWKKQRAADGPCTDMAAFTRLCPSKDGIPDGVEKYIPTIFVKQLTTEVLAKYGHFGVLNR